jgi:hypothetical protein
VAPEVGRGAQAGCLADLLYREPAGFARLAGPEDLAGLTGAFQLAGYTGFAVPDILSLLQSTAPAPVLLLALATLAALTLAATAWQARLTSPVDDNA